MSNLKRIKVELLKEEKIERLLESIGCSHVKHEQGGTLVTAMLPEHFESNNRRSVQVKMNRFMSCAIRTRDGFQGDIFNLVSYLRFDKKNSEFNTHLNESAQYIAKIIGVDFSKSFDEGIVVKDHTACLKELIFDKEDLSLLKNEIVSESILNDYIKLPYYGWVEEGISPKTQRLYGVGIDLQSKRITIPMRDMDGNLLGVKARIMNREDDDRKYIYLYSYMNHYELFNLNLAKEEIIKKKKVYIFEGEKSPMKMHQNNIKNSVSNGSSSISDVQANKIKQLADNIDVVLCFDKDKTIEEVKDLANVFEDNDVYAIFDVKNLLQEKDSPIDRGVEVFRELEKTSCFLVKKRDEDKTL